VNYILFCAASLIWQAASDTGFFVISCISFEILNGEICFDMYGFDDGFDVSQKA
jgi:hypothetical protein